VALCSSFQRNSSKVDESGDLEQNKNETISQKAEGTAALRGNDL